MPGPTHRLRTALATAVLVVAIATPVGIAAADESSTTSTTTTSLPADPGSTTTSSVASSTTTTSTPATTTTTLSLATRAKVLRLQLHLVADQAALLSTAQVLRRYEHTLNLREHAIAVLRRQADALGAVASHAIDAASTEAVAVYVEGFVPTGSMASLLAGPSAPGQTAAVYAQVASWSLQRDAGHAALLRARASASEARLRHAIARDNLNGVRLLRHVAGLEEAEVVDAIRLARLEHRHPKLSKLPASLAGITILGPETLNAQQIAGWYVDQGYDDGTGEDPLQLAQAYLNEGAAEGVRGDIAFAQSILETGGFSTMSGRNNFAGIGACDSCRGGYSFGSVELGVRAQVELLKAYADRHYSQATTALPAAYPSLDTAPVRGCCQTWTSLDGVWASGPHYGETALQIFLSMLTWAAAHPDAAGLALPPAPATAGAPVGHTRRPGTARP